MTWFLKRVPLIWFVLTFVTIFAALRSVTNPEDSGNGRAASCR
jgi:hypothetical protein